MGGWKRRYSTKNPDEQGLAASLAKNGEFAYTLLKSKDIPSHLKLCNRAIRNVPTVSHTSSSRLNEAIGVALINPDTNVDVTFMSDLDQPTKSEIDIEVNLMHTKQLELHGSELANIYSCVSTLKRYPGCAWQ